MYNRLTDSNLDINFRSTLKLIFYQSNLYDVWAGERHSKITKPFKDYENIQGLKDIQRLERHSQTWKRLKNI